MHFSNIVSELPFPLPTAVSRARDRLIMRRLVGIVWNLLIFYVKLYFVRVINPVLAK